MLWGVNLTLFAVGAFGGWSLVDAVEVLVQGDVARAGLDEQGCVATREGPSEL